MRILVLGSQLLYPPHTGGRIRTSKLFERLAREHEISWICLRRPEESDEQVAAMRACCSRLETLPFDESERFTARFYWELARNLVSPLPFVVQKYFHAALRARVTEVLKREQFDLLICDFLQPSANVIGLPFAPRVLFQHNVESVIAERHLQIRSGAAARAYLYLQWKKLSRYEARAARWFDHTIVVSDEDRVRMEQLYGVTDCSVVPTGVDADYYRPTCVDDTSGASTPADPDPAPSDIVFTGSMDWLPNVDGITWFAQEILPLIEGVLPVRLWVVGRDPLPQVIELGRSHSAIEVTGTVDDVRPYLDRARVCIVPLRVGGGTRVKIYEAMAMGKPVVSTRVGVEGLPLLDGRDVLLADEPSLFAQHIVGLLRDEPRRRALGAGGRELVTRKHSWDAAARRFGEICEDVVARRSRTSGAS